MVKLKVLLPSGSTRYCCLFQRNTYKMHTGSWWWNMLLKPCSIYRSDMRINTRHQIKTTTTTQIIIIIIINTTWSNKSIIIFYNYCCYYMTHNLLLLLLLLYTCVCVPFCFEQSKGKWDTVYYNFFYKNIFLHWYFLAEYQSIRISIFITITF